MTKRNLGKVFVTGGDGFIGSHLVESLLAKDLEVTALCQYNSFNYCGWLNPYTNDKPNNLNLVSGDVRDAGLMEDLIKGHDTVFHLASLIAIPYSYSAPESYIDTNVYGAINIAKACLKNKVKLLIHTSTSEVYGTAKYVPIDENHPLQGQSPYSASKIAADMIMESYWRSFHLPMITLRPFNTYGPRQSQRAIIPTIISQCLTKNPTIKLGNLSPTRDFNFVSDTVDAFVTLSESADQTLLGAVFNTGSGTEISVGDLVEKIAKLMNTKITVTQESERMRPDNSEVERLLANSSKLQSMTAWKPRVSLDQGILKTIEWVKESKYAATSDRYHK
jgi:NAD dependent epimerase/dehydratase